MKRFLCILLTAVLSGALFAQAPTDSLRRAMLTEKVDDYVDAIANYPLAEQEAECDFLIGSCKDSLDRQLVAVRLYDRYLGAKWMGAENVAVHILDEWFFSGKVEMYNELDYYNAFAFAEFNRSSLIGKKAAPLQLDSTHTVRFDKLRRYQVLYFYSPTCATCRVTTPELIRLAERYAPDVQFHAIDVDGDPNAWNQYVDDHLGMGHYYLISKGESDYIKDFGVTKTPQVLLLDPEGIIIGRRLDAEALDTLLSNELDLYEGQVWDDAEALIETVMATGGTVGEVHSMIRRRTEDNPRTYKILTAALFHYAMTHRGHDLRFGADTLARQEILGRPDIWWTENDGLSVVSPASLSVSLMELAPVGARIPKLKVQGSLLRRGDRAKTGVFRLRRLCGKDHRIVFYSPTCEHCRELLAALDAFRAAHPGTRILLVDMDAFMAQDPAAAEAVLQALDLSTLPMIFRTGRRGRVKDKYLDNL